MSNLQNDIIFEQEAELAEEEHAAGLHERPYWKNMKTCSECYKEHHQIVSRNSNQLPNNDLRAWEDSELHKAGE